MKLISILYAALVLICSCLDPHHCWQQKCRQNHPCDIPGPESLCDRIAIVGAGPAGVHMAYLLKKKGFKHVKIFESSCRVGGKSYTINYRGTPHDMGTVYLAPDYEPNIIALAKEFKVGELVDLPPASVWSKGRPLTFSAYAVEETLALLKTRNVSIAAGAIAKAIYRYILLHKKIFGTYKGELMPRPSKKTLYLIRGTFKEFLDRHQLFILRPLFLGSHTVQGYGQLDEIPAFYGLLWNTPRMMKGLIARMQGKANTGLYMLKQGFQTLWEKIVQDLHLDVCYNCQVVQVKRHDDNWVDSITVTYKKHYSPWRYQYRREHFDFIMWTPEMKLSLGTIDATNLETKLFKKTKAMYFTTSLIDSWKVPRGLTSVDYWFELVEGKKDHMVWVQRDSFAALNGFNGTKYQKGLLPTGKDGASKRTTVVYQMGAYKPTKHRLHTYLKSHFKKMGGKVSIQETKIWRYFPRYGDSQIQNGIIWDILEYQGHNRMWYLGSSVIFESVKSVVEYNELLVDIMEPPDDNDY